MLELGNVQYVAQGTRTLNLPRNELPDPTHKTVKKIEVDDAAAAVIGNPQHMQDIQQDSEYTYAQFSASRRNDVKARAKAKMVSSESSRYHVYSEPSELRLKLADEIKAINSFDGFLLGVHDKIEEFPRRSEFGLEQILDIEQRTAKLYETLELYKFTLRRIRAEAMKALRCQANLGPQRALNLLKDNIAKLIAAGQATNEQAVSDPE
jgi:hypothetical protein